MFGDFGMESKSEGKPWTEDSPMYTIRVTVKKIAGPRHKPPERPGCFLQVGDSFDYCDDHGFPVVHNIKGNICGPAFVAMFPQIQAMRHGAVGTRLSTLTSTQDMGLQCCPDPDGLVIFEVKRIKKIDLEKARKLVSKAILEKEKQKQ